MSVGGLLGSIAKLALGSIGGMLLGKPKSAPAAPAAATRDDAQDMANREDLMRRRKGSAADILTGIGGAEGGGGGKFVAGN